MVTLIMGHDPDRADGLAADVKRNQKRVFERGLDLPEVGKIAFGV